MCEKQIKTVIITVLLLVLLKASCLDRCSGNLCALSLHFYVFIVYLFIYFCECVVFIMHMLLLCFYLCVLLKKKKNSKT